MKTVHKIYALLLAAAMLLSLAACGSNGPGMDAQAEGADAVSAEPEATPAPPVGPDADGVPRYLTLETTDTGVGLITIPKFSTHNLDTDMAREANAMFEKIRDDLIASAEAYKNAGGAADGSATPLCTTQTAAHEDTLSVLVSYRPNAASNAQRFEALTFDTENGGVISPDRVISEIGERSRTETENAIVLYANRALGESVSLKTVYECAASGAVPQGLDGPFLSDEQKSDMLNDYRNDQLVGAETEEENDEKTDTENSWDSANNTEDKEADEDEEPAINWDDLPRSPTAYVNADGELFVRAAIPSQNDAPSVNVMVGIGENDEETTRLNPENPNGIDFGRGIIPEDAAMGLAALAMGLDGDNADEEGTAYHLTIDSTAMLATEGGHNEPAYVVSVFTGNGDTARIRVAAYYAIGVYSTQVWKMDEAAGKWMPQQVGPAYLIDAVVDGQSHDAMAVVQHKPNAYELWMRSPVAEIDLTRYAYTQGNASSMLVYAVQDNTTIRFAGGWQNNDDEFVPNKDYDEFELNAGECVLVQCKLPETPAQAVIADWTKDEGVLPLFTSEEHPVSTYQYVTADPDLEKTDEEIAEEEDDEDGDSNMEEIATEKTW